MNTDEIEPLDVNSLRNLRGRTLRKEDLEKELPTTDILLTPGQKIEIGGNSGRGTWIVLKPIIIQLTETRYDPERGITVIVGTQPIEIHDNCMGTTGFNGSNTVSFTLE